ncbi:MAG: AsmA family protein, partial [Candidatus Gastranaerophilales bacterium]|nr:AsmA family protein [Candidatus Gastranaerophilales bacterium]
MKIVKKIIFLIIISGILCTALYFAVLISIINIVDLNKYKSVISESIEKSTGFKIYCEDISFKKRLTPYLKIHMFHTMVLYPDDEVFLKLKEVDLQVKILPLVMRKIVINDAKLSRPIINISLYEDFSTSIEKYIDTSKIVNTEFFKLDVPLNYIACENYKIKFKDDSINKTFYLEGNNLILKDLKFKDRAHAILNGSVYENGNQY